MRSVPAARPGGSPNPGEMHSGERLLPASSHVVGTVPLHPLLPQYLQQPLLSRMSNVQSVLLLVPTTAQRLLEK